MSLFAVNSNSMDESTRVSVERSCPSEDDWCEGEEDGVAPDEASALLSGLRRLSAPGHAERRDRLHNPMSGLRNFREVHQNGDGLHVRISLQVPRRTHEEVAHSEGDGWTTKRRMNSSPRRNFRRSNLRVLNASSKACTNSPKTCSCHRSLPLTGKRSMMTLSGFSPLPLQSFMTSEKRETRRNFGTSSSPMSVLVFTSSSRTRSRDL